MNIYFYQLIEFIIKLKYLIKGVRFIKLSFYHLKFVLLF